MLRGAFRSILVPSALAADIAAYGTAFLTGTNEAFLGIVDLAQQAPSGFAALDRRPAR
ncbi:MAG: hypothetical protein IPG88_19905 [Gemmatimonadetes bacterium]|nr:hypothetical protein [Gemmatimonadota bacterium]